MFVGLRHGLYLGLFLTVYGVFFRAAGIHYSAWPAWVFYLAVPLAVLLAGRALRARECKSLRIERSICLGRGEFR